MEQILKTPRPLSIGLPFAGRLHQPVIMPRSGKGFTLVPRSMTRGHFYGLPELVDLITHAAARVTRIYPRSMLTVADLSPRRGGFAPGHRSHQSGRDVDLGFYMVDSRGRYQVVTTHFVGFDANARGTGNHSRLLFDLERNWELVEALLSHGTVTVNRIFIAAHLRELLLQYAEAVARPPDVRKKAAAVLSPDPGHACHFHVRITCPENQPFCR